MVFRRHGTNGGPAGQAGTARQLSGLAGCPARAARGAAAPVTKAKKEPGVDARPVLALSVQLSAAVNPRIGGAPGGLSPGPFFPTAFFGKKAVPPEAGPPSSAQVTDCSLRRKRQSSFPPLCPCSRRGIAIPGPDWPANRAAPFPRLALSAIGGASPGNSPHRTRCAAVGGFAALRMRRAPCGYFAGLRRGPRVHLRYRRCRASGGTHRDCPASLDDCCAVPAWPAGPPSVPCN